jgi:hypothetical protein
VRTEYVPIAIINSLNNKFDSVPALACQLLDAHDAEWFNVAILTSELSENLRPEHTVVTGYHLLYEPHVLPLPMISSLIISPSDTTGGLFYSPRTRNHGSNNLSQEPLVHLASPLDSVGSNANPLDSSELESPYVTTYTWPFPPTLVHRGCEMHPLSFAVQGFRHSTRPGLDPT